MINEGQYSIHEAYGRMFLLFFFPTFPIDFDLFMSAKNSSFQAPASRLAERADDGG